MNKPVVSILMGSGSDDKFLEPAYEILTQFEIPFEKRILSAHRHAERLNEYLKEANQGSIRVFIAAAGFSAALPGVVSAHTLRPVIGIPVPSGPLQGMDALLSIAQMPGGIPVATVGIGPQGPKNAALLAAQILALSDEAVHSKLAAYRKKLSEG
jgi:phosphoribosylaminoimidazole carboxylase PurE protein